MPHNALFEEQVSEQIARITRNLQDSCVYPPKIRTNEEIQESARVKAQEIFDNMGIPFRVVVTLEAEPPSSQLGWECPRCHKVWAPSIKQCDCAPEWEELKK